ncbi:DUF2332 domain-containing protein [Nocardioides sp. TRM66260-LWL]|uniref:DUF2332 domain-containing protein n=1 Tax=Nocardioides sp. TRM66260-LWL TaxID=2874478 RepID=UPI001CC4436E|nr:DUF2332 domain-containing protein [Nocardioides sp. TRM66260-LWL]MBZ5735457.1 DUF2332 domain-containing protein [Nocardioides sp. TRM66260-LWL]
MDPYGPTRSQYERFARHAAESPTFAAWSRGVAGDEEVLAWIDALPDLRRQPNLVFAAARWHGVPAPGPYAGLRAALLGDDGTIRATLLSRSTQTNEAGRLATLLPALGLIAEAEGVPLALLEVGASAGLCLLPDRWDYRWHTADGEVRLDAGQGRELRARVEGFAPLPRRPLPVAWRRGVDLRPGDVTDDDAVAWLENLVWPGQHDRLITLRAALAAAREDPPPIVAGDLLEVLEAQVAAAGAHGPVVVYHSAVIAYLDDADRDRFVALVSGLQARGACHWVSNEAASVLPSVTATLPAPLASDRRLAGGCFVLGVDGVARALTHGHGRWLAWG